MEITIGEDARNLILKKTAEIVLDKKVIKSWSGTYIRPTVNVGKPENEEDYDKSEVDGITVYYLKKEAGNKNVEIDVKGIGPFKQFVIMGF